MSILKLLFLICVSAVSALVTSRPVTAEVFPKPVVWHLINNTRGARNDHEIKKWFFQQAVECSKEHPVTSEEIQMLKDHKIPNHKNAKCLVGCVFKRVNWINNKGMFDDSVAYKLSEEEYPNDKAKLENAKKLYEMCKEVNKEEVSDGEEGCERSAILAMCLTENASKLGFFAQ